MQKKKHLHSITQNEDISDTPNSQILINQDGEVVSAAFLFRIFVKILTRWIIYIVLIAGFYLYFRNSTWLRGNIDYFSFFFFWFI